MKVLTLASLVVTMSLSSLALADKAVVNGQDQIKEDRYDIELAYDSQSKDLTISYEKFTTSICHLSFDNLVVTAATPSLVGNIDVGLISFDVARPEGLICLMALGNSGGSVTIPAFDGKVHALLIDGESYGYVRLNAKGQAELVNELPVQEEKPTPAPVAVYNIDFDYDASNHNLVIGYRTIDLTSSICHYEAENLEVSASTPTFGQPVALGLVAFDTDKVSNGICLTAFGHSGGSITVDNFSGIPSLLLIDGVSYGYITLGKDGQSVELVENLK